MLNDAQRNSLRIVMRLIEEKMRAIERQLDQPLEHWLLFEVRNDITPDIERALRQPIQEVYTLIGALIEQFALPLETELASREILKGLSHLWVMLQESDSNSFQRYGTVNPALAPELDPQIDRLARLMLELERIALGNIEPASQAVGQEQKGPGERQRP